MDSQAVEYFISLDSMRSKLLDPFFVDNKDALLEQELLFFEGEGRYILAESVRDRISEQGAETVGNVGYFQDLPHKYPPNLKQIVQILHRSKKGMARSELQKALKLVDRVHFLREYLQPALESDLIEMTILDKPNSSKQKYRLTELGRKVAEDLK